VHSTTRFAMSLIVAGWVSVGTTAIADEASPPHVAPEAMPETVPLFDNLGTHHHAITASKEAQQYFDQGLRLVYAFNHDEAIKAFKEGARLDPNCAMCYWGIALALGPNINLPMEPTLEPTAYEAVTRAKALASKVSKPEQAYINALATRYAAEPGDSRAGRDTAYATAMRKLVARYPKDLDAATLFAEAMLDLRPWDYWTHDGKPQSGTLEIVATLEHVIKTDPNHPGACHYYIHAVEASFHPERALPCAERLPKLMPGAGHLVHMPAHVYMRLGRYGDAVERNAEAATVDEHYFEGRHPKGFYPMVYYPHNLHFLWAAATMEGRSAEALRAARSLAAAVPASAVREVPPLEMFTPTPLFALARFGKWQEILDEPAPPPTFIYTKGIWRYVRGLAFTATGRADEARAELGTLQTLLPEIPSDRMVGLNSATKLLTIASKVLAGELAARQGQIDNAVSHFQEAITVQDGLTYDEPPPWYYPVRQSLGAVLLKAGRAKEAEAVYREDLRRNPENGWSLYGLAQALRAQKDEKEAAEIEKRFAKAWTHADVTLTASRF